MMAICYLSKQGYGTVKELMELDTPEFLDLLEYEAINQSIQNYEMERARKG